MKAAAYHANDDDDGDGDNDDDDFSLRAELAMLGFENLPYKSRV